MADSWSLPRARSGRAATVVDELLDPEGHAACEQEIGDRIGNHLFACSFGVLFFPILLI
jgi:hypothetical protein